MTCPGCKAETSAGQSYCAACGARLPAARPEADLPATTAEQASAELATGATFASRYQVVEELGHGGTGRVYKVVDTQVKVRIALKVLKPELAADRDGLERFSRELRVARRVTHRNVCRVYDLGRSGPVTYLTMEYVEGEDLRRLMRKIGVFGAGQMVRIARQLLDGLAEAHRLGVVHRDLKPQNVMVDEDGNAKIMDFGIARLVHGKGITGAGVHGVPHTVVVDRSPQLAEGQQRGLVRDLARALTVLGRVGPHPRADVAARVRQIPGPQYVREVLAVTIHREGGQVTLTPVVDEAARAALEAQYFGLRVLATTHDDWTTAQIIEAYRGQAHAERAFRDLEDTWIEAFRPQYHWTDQKLIVHASLVMLGLLLGRVLLRRARQRVGFTGSLRRLIQTLGQIRQSTIVHHHHGPGRPRVTTHVDTTDESLRPLAQALGAWPAADRPHAVYTPRRR